MALRFFRRLYTITPNETDASGDCIKNFPDNRRSSGDEERLITVEFLSSEAGVFWGADDFIVLGAAGFRRVVVLSELLFKPGGLGRSGGRFGGGIHSRDG